MPSSATTAAVQSSNVLISAQLPAARVRSPRSFRLPLPPPRPGQVAAGTGSRRRSRPAYTLQRRPRRNPTSVTPKSSATATASDDGADTDATTGIPAATAFCTISYPHRPLTMSTVPDSGSRSPSTPQPTSLSTALCRPTSSRVATSDPSAVNSPAACSPPVTSNRPWADRNASGSPYSTSTGTVTSSATRCSPRSCSASSDAEPHTPQALDTIPERTGASSAGPSVSTVTTLNFWSARSTSAQYETWCGTPGRRPSACRNPVASSKSWPGVRIVTATVCVRPPAESRISSGSSVTTLSRRRTSVSPSSVQTLARVAAPGRSALTVPVSHRISCNHDQWDARPDLQPRPRRGPRLPARHARLVVRRGPPGLADLPAATR